MILINWKLSLSLVILGFLKITERKVGTLHGQQGEVGLLLYN